MEKMELEREVRMDEATEQDRQGTAAVNALLEFFLIKLNALNLPISSVICQVTFDSEAGDEETEATCSTMMLQGNGLTITRDFHILSEKLATAVAQKDPLGAVLGLLRNRGQQDGKDRKDGKEGRNDH